MRNYSTIRPALALVLAAGAIVATPASARPMDGTSDTPDTRAGRHLAAARVALAKGVPAAAVRQAEAAVARAPRGAIARATLGRAYLAAGRFRSAEAALADALTLDRSLHRVAINHALAQIALGRAEKARTTLDGLSGVGPDADVGLAFALLGETDRARDLLLAAARAPGADARTRQNLAFAYALEGRWADAAAVAAQDIPAELIADRLRRWAMIGQLRGDPAMQLGAVLGVLPIADEGQPSALALAVPAPIADGPSHSPPPVPLARTPALSVTLRDSAPSTEMADSERSTSAFPPSTPIGNAPDSRAVTSISVAAPSDGRAFSGPPRMRTARQPARPDGAAERDAIVRPSLLHLSSVPATRAPQPRLTWAVQLGAYIDPARTEIAWDRLSRRARFLLDHRPTGSTLREGPTVFHRLSVSGLDSYSEARRLCTRIRMVGGQCFVRRDAGDRPVRWVKRDSASRRA